MILFFLLMKNVFFLLTEGSIPFDMIEKKMIPIKNNFSVFMINYDDDWYSFSKNIYLLFLQSH